MSVIRVCVFGPESTGKSTLAVQLAEHFGTVYSPEFCRIFADEHGTGLGPEHTVPIANGQVALEDECAAKANRLLILDTDLVSTCIWSDALYGSVPPAVAEMAKTRVCDLYLLLDIDVARVDDPQRVWPGAREEFFERCERELIDRKLRHVVIGGDWESRFKCACDAIDSLLKERGL